MRKIRFIHWVFFFSGLFGILIPDQITKWLAVQGIIGDTEIIRGIFYVTAFQRNPGTAFGLGLPIWVQIIGSTVILFLLVRLGFDYIFIHQKSSLFGFDSVLSSEKSSIFRLVLLGAIVGGGLSNLLGRILEGNVVDFIVLRPIPTFNIADVGITVGIILLFGTIVLSSGKTKIKK
jgi:lipoprotein signal peptidase